MKAIAMRCAPRWGGLLCGLGLCCVLWTCVAGAGQTGLPSTGSPIPPASQSTPPSGRPPFGQPGDQPASMNPERLEHMREDERHKRLLADTTKLVELTNQLKTEVDKASKDELSLDVVRKAAEIEKLAHDVKERMKS